MQNKKVHLVAVGLLIIGGLNWLAVAILPWELSMLTDIVSPTLTQVVYILVGLAAIYEILTHKQTCKMCG